MCYLNKTEQLSWPKLWRSPWLMLSLHTHLLTSTRSLNPSTFRSFYLCLPLYSYCWFQVKSAAWTVAVASKQLELCSVSLISHWLCRLLPGDYLQVAALIKSLSGSTSLLAPVEVKSGLPCLAFHNLPSAYLPHPAWCTSQVRPPCHSPPCIWNCCQ